MCTYGIALSSPPDACRLNSIITATISRVRCSCLISFFWAKLHRHAVPFPPFLNSGAWRQIQIRGGLRLSPRNQNARLAIRLVPIMVNTRDRNLQNETCANIGGTFGFFGRLFPCTILPIMHIYQISLKLAACLLFVHGKEYLSLKQQSDTLTWT